jgi:hypothetical protein
VRLVLAIDRDSESVIFWELLMNTAVDVSVEDDPGGAGRSGRRIALLVAPALLVAASMILAVRPMAARQGEEEAAATKFHKIGNHFVNVASISHVIDEPGANMPPGSLQAFFDGGPDWISIGGEEANVFRKMLVKESVDLTPKPAAEAKATEAGEGKKPAGAKAKAAKKKPSFIEIR